MEGFEKGRSRWAREKGGGQAQDGTKKQRQVSHGIDILGERIVLAVALGNGPGRVFLALQGEGGDPFSSTARPLRIAWFGLGCSLRAVPPF